MRRRRWIPTLGPLLIFVLMLLAGIGMILPRAWTERILSVTQVLVPFQDAVNTAAEKLASAVPDEGPVSREHYEQLLLEKELHEHRAAALAARVEQLQNDVALLENTRLWGVGGRRLGAQGKLVPARVIAHDVLSWRDSYRVTAGSLQGVRPHQAVTSREFTLELRHAAGENIAKGMAILLGEVLVGTVGNADTHTSRVRLMSDLGVETKVLLGRFQDDEFFSPDRYFWMTGRGNGRMEIQDVHHRDVEAGLVAEGDLVLADPTLGDLPVPMTIGRIASIEVNHKEPLLAVVTVEAGIDPSTLNRVYIYVPEDASTP